MEPLNPEDFIQINHHKALARFNTVNLYNEVTAKSFVPYLKLLQHDTHWTYGTWHFSDQDIREWNKIQNVSADIDTLTRYLRKKLKESIQKSKVALTQ